MKTCEWGTHFMVGLAVFAFSCGQDESESVRTPFAKAGKATVFQYETRPVGQSPTMLSIRFVGKTTFNGQTVDHYQGTYQVPSGIKTVDVYGHHHDMGRIELAGFSVQYPAGSGTDYTVTFDEVISLDEAAIPVGVEQTRTISGSIKLGSSPPVSGSGRIRFTKTTEDANVESRLGTVSGVHVFEGEGTIESAGGTGLWDVVIGKPVRLEAWYHPVLGVLKVEAPDFGLGTTLLGEHDCGNPHASDFNTIQKVGVVSVQTREFKLSSYDCSGQFDADKMRHAKMYLELRWADETKAKTTDRPGVELLFATAWGYFPFQLVQSPVSIFHPEENKQGFTYWYAYVEQGAKNEPGDNGILYRIEVTLPDYMTSPVRVTARIRYPVYHP